MIKSLNIRFACAVLLACGFAQLALCQDTVTIPKSRLQELERKERELKALKGEVEKTQTENQRMQKPHQENGSKSAAPAAAAAPARVSPSIGSLPPLQPGEVVEAADLGAQYLADPVAADQRYRKHRFQVRGEVVGFAKTVLVRNYGILLKAGDRVSKVACDFYPSSKYKAVFAVKNGTELVGVLENETRVPLARAGETVTIEGECTGHNDLVVKMSRCVLE